MSDMSAVPVINFTAAAAAKVYRLVAEENNPNLNLRAFITGGGCSGFQYGFTFDEVIHDDDTVIVKETVIKDESEAAGADCCVSVKLLVDALSIQYLRGADIDYREDVSGAQFVIRNPNAKSTCGCGSSFSAE